VALNKAILEKPIQEISPKHKKKFLERFHLEFLGQEKQQSRKSVFDENKNDVMNKYNRNINRKQTKRSV